MKTSPFVVALVTSVLLPAGAAADPAARNGLRVASQPEARVQSGIVRLTCGGTGGVGSSVCSIYGGGDYPWQFPLGAPPTGADLAAANQVMRIDYVQMNVSGPSVCTFRLGVADPGGAALGFPGPQVAASAGAGGGVSAEISARFHVPGIEMEFTVLSCNARVAGADVQIYYTRVPRGR